MNKVKQENGKPLEIEGIENCKTIEEIDKLVEKNWQGFIELQKQYNVLLDKAKAMIKHPHFQYAFCNLDTGEIKFKLKPFWKWFSGKRTVKSVVQIKKIKTQGLADYRRPQ